MTLLAQIARRENRAVMAVTHDPRTLPFADRLIRIEDGLIVDNKVQRGRQAASRTRSSSSERKLRANA